VLYTYILRVFLAFSHEACELGMHGEWSADRVSSEAEEFLRRFTIDAYYKEGHDRYQRQFPSMTSNWDGSLLAEVQRSFRKSEEWRRHESALLSVAEEQGAKPAVAVDSVQLEKDAATPGGLAGSSSLARLCGDSGGWGAITIEFLNEHTVRFECNGNSANFEYSDLEFRDRRTGKPKRSWKILLALAHGGGTLRTGAVPGVGWSCIEKRMQEIRKQLRIHTGINGDPIPYQRGIGYQAVFKVVLGRSFHP
jgi:hypothetical protein